MVALPVVFAGTIVVFIVTLLYFSIRIGPEYDRLVVFRLGRAIGERGPGLVLLIPFVDRPVRVDLREVFFDVPPQTRITKDNAPVDIDFIVYMRVMDPVSSVVKVQRVMEAARWMAITNLRAVIDDISLHDVLAKREQINQVMQAKLDEVTDRWGVKVNAVEIKEVRPPREIDCKTMSLQYMETLKSLGASPSTKFVFPAEFSRLMQPISDIVGGKETG